MKLSPLITLRLCCLLEPVDNLFFAQGKRGAIGQPGSFGPVGKRVKLTSGTLFRKLMRSCACPGGHYLFSRLYTKSRKDVDIFIER